MASVRTVPLTPVARAGWLFVVVLYPALGHSGDGDTRRQDDRSEADGLQLGQDALALPRGQLAFGFEDRAAVLGCEHRTSQKENPPRREPGGLIVGHTSSSAKIGDLKAPVNTLHRRSSTAMVRVKSVLPLRQFASGYGCVKAIECPDVNDAIVYLDLGVPLLA